MENDKSWTWYHEQWGTPTYDDTKLFQLLIIGIFQVGLNWKMIAGKKDVFAKYFYNYDISKVAATLPDEIEKMLMDTNMIRNERKIKATINDAQAILSIQKEYGSFSNYLWKFVDNKPLINDYTEHDEVPTSTELSKLIAVDMKKYGFTFVGPIVIYMFMKASGMIKDNVLNK
ncbi:DNA-3-methyladenine glycosylase I [Dellaglioa sp. BT-FLS60]